MNGNRKIEKLLNVSAAHSLKGRCGEASSRERRKKSANASRDNLDTKYQIYMKTETCATKPHENDVCKFFTLFHILQPRSRVLSNNIE